MADVFDPEVAPKFHPVLSSFPSRNDVHPILAAAGIRRPVREIAYMA